MATDADILRRVALVRDFGWDACGFWAWSSGERLAVVLVVDASVGSRSAWGAITTEGDLPSSIWSELGSSRDAAELRWAGERFGGDLLRCRRWVCSLAAELRAGVA